MAKDDVPPLPLHPPRKRRQLEQALDIHLAMWSSSPTLSLTEKRRVEGERVRRKRARQKVERLGLLIGPEGATPIQQEVLAEMLKSYQGNTSAIWHPRTGSSVHTLCKSLGVPVEVPRGGDAARTVIRNATKIIALPRGEYGPTWDHVLYARHRNLPVDVIMPNGERR